MTPTLPRRALPGMLALLAAPAIAADYPARPVRVVVPFAAGSGSDLVTRAVMRGVSQELGQPFVVDNRTGASGIVGIEAVTRAAPDGYTLLASSGSPITINPLIFPNLPYDPVRDLAPISQMGIAPAALLINAATPARDIATLLELARQQPGRLSYGSFGVGTGVHIAFAVMAKRAGVEMVHVPYRGLGPAVGDLVAGQITMTLADLVTAVGHIESGRLRALAVNAGKRSALMPDVPTFTEAGWPELETTFPRFAVYGPAGLPQEVAEHLSGAITRAVAAPVVQRQFGGLGYEMVGSTPTQLAAALREDLERWGALVRQVGVLDVRP